MTAINVESIDCVAPVRALLGEGPLWDRRIKRLLFLDIKDERLFVFDPASGSCQAYTVPGMVSALAPARGGGYVCALRSGFARLALDEDCVEISAMIDPERDRPGNRFNDGKPDPAGGFWAGSMDDAEKDADAGSWWRLKPDGKSEKLDGGYHVTNGPAFDPANGRVFLTDSARRTIFVAQSDGTLIGQISVFIQCKEEYGYPDGMEIDREGALWVAFWDGGAIRRFSPKGELLQTVSLPVPRPTSIAFVKDQIFVTSARIGLDEAALEHAPESGGLFRVKVSTPLSDESAWREYNPV